MHSFVKRVSLTGAWVRAAMWAAILVTPGITAESPGIETLPAKLARCRQVVQQAGLPPGEIEEFLRADSPAGLAGRVEVCLQMADEAYPRRALDPDAIKRGGTLYSTYGCAFCHGKDARGGDGGPNLLRSQRVLHDQKGELIGEVVLKGVPNTAMRAFQLSQGEVADLAEFLHSFQVMHLDPARHLPASIVTGHLAAGRKYFESRCAKCHSPSGDLKGIGSLHQDPKQLQQYWLMPAQTRPVTATVTEKDGRTMEGRLLHMDEFQVTLDLEGAGRRTLERHGKDPTIVVHDPLAAHRELLQSYSDADIHDVTAYLLTLTGPNQVTHSATPPASADDAGLTPEAILHPSPESWPTYAGDYSARRYSSLNQINQSNVGNLTLAWSSRLTAGPNDKGLHSLIISGEGRGDLFTSAPANVRASPLEFNGVIYLSTPDNAWAVDARNGETLWHFNWKTRGGMHLGNRGLGMWGNYLYLETPDDYLVSLDARTGRKRWQVEIASFEEQYHATPAPVVIGNHVIVGVGFSLDSPGFLQSFDPQTGALQWKHYNVPMNVGDPGLETWKNLDAARHGGAASWMPGAYDPETNLYIYGTGNPTPAYFAEPRGNRDALFTCSIIAVDVDTGKMAWYYQTSPNDTHDWDSSQTPVLADITIGGRVHKVAMTAGRNGYFFVVDRRTGEHLLTSKFSDTVNWAKPKVNELGQPVRIPAKDNDVGGALVSNANEGASNWPPASYSPDYRLFYVPAAESWAVYYKRETDPLGAMALGGKEELNVQADSYLKAIDPVTGSIAWSVKYPTRGGLANGVLTTAGRLLFSGDTAGNFVARDPSDGRPLWHTHIGDVSNAPETYVLDKKQYILVAAGDTLYAFTLN